MDDAAQDEELAIIKEPKALACYRCKKKSDKFILCSSCEEEVTIQKQFHARFGK